MTKILIVEDETAHAEAIEEGLRVRVERMEGRRVDRVRLWVAE